MAAKFSPDSQVLTHQDLVEKHQISNKFSTIQDRSQVRSTNLKVQAPPGRGCEVFITNLPRDILMKKLHDFVSACGEVYEIRMLMEFSGFNKGLCYVKYCTKESAKMASLVLHSCEIIPGYPVMIKMSYDNNKLMLMRIPHNIPRNEVILEMTTRVGDGLLSVVFTDQNQESDEDDNTKCALLKYDTHRQALEARRTLWPGVQLWGTFTMIEWAEPQDLKLARVLYFKNFPVTKTRYDLYCFLRSVLNVHNLVKIHVNAGTGYILFSSEKHRRIGMKILKDYDVYGRKLQLGYKKYYPGSASSNESANLQGKEKMEKSIDVGRANFDSIFDNIPIFKIAPIYTKPGIYNELEGIKHIVHQFLHKKFPLSIWTILDSTHEQVLPNSNVIKLMVTVNDADYMFLLIQVSSDLASTTFYMPPVRSDKFCR